MSNKVPKTITREELPAIFKKIKANHTKYLNRYGVGLPSLMMSGKFTKNAIVLGLLAKYEGQAVSKTDITNAVREQFPNTNDSQQARHLGRQNGWYIISGTRGDKSGAIDLKAHEYCLVSLTEPYPGFLGAGGHRSARGGENFAELKAKFNFRCATCGSKEGEENFLNSSVVTKLQEAHMDPNGALDMQNMIPQCSECNRAYRDWFIFDGQGRVRDINYRSSRWRLKYILKESG